MRAAFSSVKAGSKLKPSVAKKRLAALDVRHGEVQEQHPAGCAGLVTAGLQVGR